MTVAYKTLWGLLTFCLWARPMAADVLVEVLARSGDAAPDTGMSLVFQDFNPPVINNAGEVAFYATLRGPGVNSTNETAVFRRGSSGTQLLLRTGEHVPGTAAGTVLGFIYPISINDSGTIMCMAYLRDSLGVSIPNSTMCWLFFSSGQSRIVFSEGTPSPADAGNAVFGGGSVAGWALNGSDTVIFDEGLLGSSVTGENDRGIWRASNAEIATIAREGDGITRGADEYFFGSPFQTPRLNDAGLCVFDSRVTGVHLPATTTSAIWWNSGGQTQLGIAYGDLAPDISPPAQFAQLHVRGINAAGDTLFFGSLQHSATVGNHNDSGYWCWQNGQASLLVRESHDLELGSSALIDSRGMVAALTSGLYRREPDGVTRLLPVRDLAATDNSCVRFQRMLQLSTNGVGHAIMVTDMLSDAENVGLFAVDQQDTPYCLARTGDFFDTQDGIQRIISSLDIACCSGGEDGHPRCINDRGEMVYWLTFTDGTQALVKATIQPEYCACDWNRLGGLDSQDYFDFLESFFSGFADFDHRNCTDSQDLFSFVECFVGGCDH